MRNAGKSCLVNALTSQTVSVVSDVAGTTTDGAQGHGTGWRPARHRHPGIDDAGDVGDLRVQRPSRAERADGPCS
ncbi:MAG: GTPase [Adlercreutzia equolifaciens]